MDETLYPDENGYIHAYVDGACRNNGQENAQVGIGVWFADEHPYNVSKKIPSASSNNQAELLAAIELMKIAKEKTIQKIAIHTDSEYVYKGITEYLKDWKERGWLTTNKKSIENIELWKELDDLNNAVETKWYHTKSHSNDYGNIKADIFASRAISKFDDVLKDLSSELLDEREIILTYIGRLRETQDLHREEKFITNKNPTIFNQGDEVFVATHPLSYAGYGLAKKFMPKNEGPYIIKNKIGRNTYLIIDKYDESKVKSANINQLVITTRTTPTQPPHPH